MRLTSQALIHVIDDGGEPSQQTDHSFASLVSLSSMFLALLHMKRVHASKDIGKLFDLRGASSSYSSILFGKATHSIISEHVAVHYLCAAEAAAASTSHEREWNFHNYMQHAICKSPQEVASLLT